MTMVLSGSRPMVRLFPTTYSFKTRPSNCSVSFAIMPSPCLSLPLVHDAGPPAARDLHDHDRDVVHASITIRRGNQVIADPLWISHAANRLAHHALRHHLRE